MTGRQDDKPNDPGIARQAELEGAVDLGSGAGNGDPAERSLGREPKAENHCMRNRSRAREDMTLEQPWLVQNQSEWRRWLAVSYVDRLDPGPQLPE
jgi:hypothetical protein